VALLKAGSGRACGPAKSRAPPPAGGATGRRGRHSMALAVAGAGPAGARADAAGASLSATGRAHCGTGSLPVASRRRTGKVHLRVQRRRARRSITASGPGPGTENKRAQAVSCQWGRNLNAAAQLPLAGCQCPGPSLRSTGRRGGVQTASLSTRRPPGSLPLLPAGSARPCRRTGPGPRATSRAGTAGPRASDAEAQAGTGRCHRG
jgi:hypothetical protein